jgi:hypothetical protein
MDALSLVIASGVLGPRVLYLYTDTHTDYYARLGWHPIEERTS